VWDVSNATFTIPSPVTVTYPNGVETLVGCATASIAWTKTTCLGTWNLAYSTNNGSTWTDIVNVNDNGSANQTYNWTVPNGVTASQALVRVRSYNYNTITDQSNAVFNIIPSNDITVTSPNGGENWIGLSSHTITWTNLPSASGFYIVQYSTNAGSTWNTLATNITGNSYTWTVPNVPSTQYQVKVIDYQNQCKFDVSNANFTVSPATPILTYPNGGETLNIGCDYQILWQQNSLYTYARLDYSIDNGATWVNIVNGASNYGYFYWNVPTTITPSTTCLIRLSNYQDLSVWDVSNATFTIPSPVNVTYPNGGETLVGCATASIAWTKTTCLGTWNLAYSTNNGSTWTDIVNVNDNGSANQTYNWTVPNGITASQALVRVRSYNYNTITDQSNAVFNIIPSNDITVTSPNGGENWIGLSSHTITWTNLPSASGFYIVQYSTNAGSTWNTLATNITGNSYTWTVPNVPSTQYQVKVIDYQNQCKFDVSNANFTVSPATPILTYPNGGETLNIGCDYQILWQQNSLYTYARLDYSLDNGATWVNIVNGASNYGYFYWNVPTTITPSTNCLIRLSNYQDLSVWDVSNATFTIPSPVTVTYPNGGETLVGCATASIAWTKTTCLGTWNLAYSTNNGSTWTDIVNVNDNGSANQTYNWTVPNGITASQALVRVRSYNYNTITDQSNAVFNIIPSNDITVTSPNGGENWIGLSSHTITWTNLPSASGFYIVQYSTNAGSTWNTLATNITGNSYTWTVPNVPSTQYQVKVIDYQNQCKFDVSNANFTVSPATPILTYPNGGETFYAGMDYQITWDQASIYSYVRLDYSLDNGVTWVNIVNGASNYGNFYWNCPNVSSTTALVRISNYQDLSVVDVSDAVFTIKPAVLILTPNGDNGTTVWGGCTITSITFERSPAYSTYKIEYSVNNGTSWTLITSNWSTTANPATYNWTMPNLNNVPTLVKVSPTSNTSYSDQSDNTFTIRKPVTIIQPNFGGIMQVGTNYNIQWTSDGISNLYDIFYSTNGGASFTNIVLGYNTSNNTYSWNVPNLPSNNCRIWVRDNVNNCKSDTSDIAFIISTTAPPITLQTPNGVNDTLYGCSNKLVTWNETTTYGTYDLHYSTNGGSTWTAIVTNYATTSHQYSWVVPNINSSTVLLRVRQAGSLTNYDLSDAYFTILKGALVAAPATTTLCPGQNIQLVATGGSNYSWSPATGLSSTSIFNPVASPASSTQYIVQSNNAGCILADTVQVNVTPAATNASVSISANPSGAICAGTSVTFTATPVNGGNASYQWKVNGSNVGTNSATYTSSSLTNNAIVTCVMTSDVPCVGTNPATSNSITMNVNSSLTPSVTVSASPSTSICFGTAVTFTANVTNGGSAPSYQWKLNGNNVGNNASTYSSTSLNNNDVITVVITSNASCLSTTTANSSNTSITVSNVPNQPGSISGSSTFCSGVSQLYSVAAVNGATSYTWTLPNGWTGTSTSNSITATPSSFPGNITVTANNSCGASAIQTLSVTANNPPVQPGAITGSSTFCQGNALTYSISAVSGATSYTWSLPNGWTGSSTSTSINATAGANGGTISVTANSACGSSTAQTLSVSPNSSVAQPGAITGSTSFCQGNALTYSISAVSGATSYTWTLPNGWTGSSTTTSINATAGSNGGTISVIANGTCGSSPAQTLTVSPSATPAQPGSITGSSSYCLGQALSYSISAVSGASSYTWTLPNGWTGSSSTTSISTIGSTAGNISVVANGTCGSSAAQTLAVAPATAPAQPGAITGNSSYCIGQSISYSISAVNGASSYTWTLPNGWTGSSTTTSISSVGSTAGTISVTANNSCGIASAAQTLAVAPATAPAQPSAITGNSNYCLGQAVSYSISAVSGASSYTWTLPNGWTGSSTSTNISSVGSTAGTISVTANNSCGTSSAAQTLAVAPDAAPAQPGTISGNSSYCLGQSVSYSILPVIGASSYTWTLPNGWTGSSTTTSISSIGSTAGTISVTANNSCGTASIAQTLAVAPSTGLSQPGAITGPTTYCTGLMVTYSIPAVSGASSYTWTLPNGWSGTSPTATLNAIAGPSGTISVVANGGCGSSIAQTLAVSGNSAPAQPGSISGSTVLCGPGSSTYSIAPVSDATSYTWTLPATWTGSSTSDNITVTNSSSGGNISVTALNGCGSSAAQTLAVTIPSIDISTSTSGNTITATQSGALYQWLDCSASNAAISGETTQSFTATSNGNYAVKIDLSGCVDTSACVAMTILGLENTAAVSALQLYPNPTMDKVTIACSRPTFIRMYNSLGQLLESFMVQQNYVLNMEHFSNGVYYLQTSDSKSLKLIKQ
jgi:phage-related protein